MPKVEIYTTMFCPFCHKAKKLLKLKHVDFIEYDVSSDSAGRKKMTELSDGQTSVPQIFIDNKHIGGCDDLYDLEDDGKLDGLLGIAS